MAKWVIAALGCVFIMFAIGFTNNLVYTLLSGGASEEVAPADAEADAEVGADETAGTAARLLQSKSSLFGEHNDTIKL